MIFIPQEQMLDRNTYYFECCAGLGDTMLTCGYMYALELKYQAPIRLIVKPTHAFVPPMYDITDAWVIGKDISASFLEKHSDPVPKKGMIYAAHPCKHPELWEFFKPVYDYTSTIRFLTWFKQFLGIEEYCRLRYPLHYPELRKPVADRCAQLAPLNRIAVLSPEAVSVPPLPSYFWKELADRLYQKGLTVVSNVINPENTVSGTHYVEMASSDAVALCMKCHSAYSVRSGLCDLISEKGPGLHVFYPRHNTFFLYEMNAMFPGADIDEQIILPE